VENLEEAKLPRYIIRKINCKVIPMALPYTMEEPQSQAKLESRYLSNLQRSGPIWLRCTTWTTSQPE
jgi:hypothetical protein